MTRSPIVRLCPYARDIRSSRIGCQKFVSRPQRRPRHVDPSSRIGRRLPQPSFIDTAPCALCPSVRLRAAFEILRRCFLRRVAPGSTAAGIGATRRGCVSQAPCLAPKLTTTTAPWPISTPVLVILLHRIYQGFTSPSRPCLRILQSACPAIRTSCGARIHVFESPDPPFPPTPRLGDTHFGMSRLIDLVVSRPVEPCASRSMKERYIMDQSGPFERAYLWIYGCLLSSHSSIFSF